jgi:hypothetical protein
VRQRGPGPRWGRRVTPPGSGRAASLPDRGGAGRLGGASAAEVGEDGLHREGILHGVIFPDDPRFFNPTDMVAAIQGYLNETGQRSSPDSATTRVSFTSHSPSVTRP